MKAYSKDDLERAFLMAWAMSRRQGNFRDRNKMGKMTEKTAKRMFREYLNRDDPGIEV